MRRKLIKQGLGALTICLPKQWVVQTSLKGGDEVDIDVLGKGLVINAKGKPIKREIQLKITTTSKEYLRNLLNQLYRAGYDKITLNLKSQEQSILAQKFIQMFLLGFEITKNSGKSVTAESISEPGEEKNKLMLRRIFFIIQESFQILNQDKNFSKVRDINRNTRKVTQYDNFLRRSYAKFPSQKDYFSWELVNALLLIQHSFYHIYLKKIKIKKNKELAELFNNITTSFLKGHIENIGELSSKADKLVRNLGDHYSCELARLQYLLCNPMIGLLVGLGNDADQIVN